jgi:hypothetical protein
MGKIPMSLIKIVQESIELRNQFVMELSAKVKHFCCGQYEESSPEMLAFKDGVATAIGMMSIDLLGAVKTKGMLEKFAISSQISLLEAELERKKGMISYTRDMKSTWNNEIIQEDILYLTTQLEEIKKLLK